MPERIQLVVAHLSSYNSRHSTDTRPTLDRGSLVGRPWVSEWHLAVFTFLAIGPSHLVKPIPNHRIL